MEQLISHLRIVAFAVWAAIHQGVGTRGDGPLIATACAKAVAIGNSPIYDSLEEDVAVMAYWAWHESNLNLSAVNPTGRSWGAWQQDASVAKETPAFTQAAAWYKHLRYGVGRCKNPAAIMWGSCNFRLVVTPFGTAEDAANLRVAKARSLLEKAMETLP